MSTLLESWLPPPRSSDAFEGLVFDIFTARLSNTQLKRNGRSGQAQQGVDIGGPLQQGFIGIQCKNHPATSIAAAEIDAEVEKAEAFRPYLSHYVIATSAKRDATISQYIFSKSEERKQHGKFTLEIFFWEDLCHEVARHPPLLRSHFPDVIALASSGQPTRTEPTPPSSVWEQERIQKHREVAFAGISEHGDTGFMELLFSGVGESVHRGQRELCNALRTSQIQTLGWPIGVLLEGARDPILRPRMLSDGVCSEVISLSGIYDYWVLSQSGEFYLLESLFDGGRSEQTKLLFFDTRIHRITEALMFCARLYTGLGFPATVTVSLNVRYQGLRGREMKGSRLTEWPPKRNLAEDVIEASIHEPLSTLQTTSSLPALVKRLTEPLFLVFDLFEIPDARYDHIVTYFAQGKAVG